LQLQFFILAALVAVAAANSYKAAEYAPKYETKYEEVTYVSLWETTAKQQQLFSI
jgi:hypothetical protein